MVNYDKFLICWTILFLGCGDPSSFSQEDNKSSQVWLCHNPLSELHGEVCIEKTSVYRGRHQPCYWAHHERIKNSYCWLLEERSCIPPLEMAWQKNNCHHFENGE